VTEPYLLAGQLSELERLQLQARVWNPFGESLLAAWTAELQGARVLDIGCGALGWVPVLSHAVRAEGEVVGTDVDERLLSAARASVEAEGLTNVKLIEDDLFASALEPGFDLVHARFQLAPLGRVEEQLNAYRRLLRKGGLLVVEDPDPSSWHFNPPAEAAERLIELIVDAFSIADGDFGVGRRLGQLIHDQLRTETHITARVLALPPGHAYLRLPLQFSASLRPRLLQLVSETKLDELEAAAERELADPSRWGTTFTLIQAVGRG
jgi:ubiquinone/menaquinone biosynthesis C-methylase UbiE